MITTSFVMIFLLFLGRTEAQVNLKIGYNLDYSTYQAHNQILEKYNAANPWLAKKFNDLTILSGLQLGFRLRGEFVGADFTWERSTGSKDAKGITSAGDNFTKQLEYKMNRVGFGLETFNRYFGIGTNVYWENFNISTTIASLETDERIFNNDRFGSKVYLIFSAPGSQRLSISLQPYMAIPWSHYNLGPLASHLGVSTREGWIQENLHFGFSIVFYNGPQR